MKRRLAGVAVAAAVVLTAQVAATPAGATQSTRSAPTVDQASARRASSMAAPTEVTPNGTYSNWTWPATSTGYYNFDIHLTIQGHTAAARYFWSHQFGFIGGDGGYLGLQMGSTPNRTKIALFSIWGANGARGDNCGQFVEGTPGWTCRIDPFPWVTNRAYRLRVWAVGTDAQGEWWGAWVQDTVTGVDRHVGAIRVPAPWGWLNTSSVSWTENFGQHAPTCSELPWARSYWAFPTANGNNRVAIASHRPHIGTGDCPRYSRILQTPTGHVQEMGRAERAWPACNSWFTLHNGPPNTWKVNAPAFFDPLSPPPSYNCALRRGDSGEHVRQLQISLAYCNIPNPGPVNGIYGPETENAVRWIQAVTGNKQTGVYGPEVRLAMGWVIGNEEGTETRCGGWLQYGFRDS